MISSSVPISIPNIKALAQILFEYLANENSVLFYSKGNNSKMGDNLDKEKNTGHLCFHEESI